MGRPFYPSEIDDPDLDWLVSNFLYERPDYIPVESGALPLMLMPFLEAPEPVEVTADDVAVKDVQEEVIDHAAAELANDK